MNCSDTPLEDYWEYQLSQNIYKYGGIILLVIGIIGNVLSMIVLLRKKFRTTTTGVYLFALSVTDCTVIIWAQFLRHALRGLTGIDLPNQYPWFCKLWYFIIKVTTTASGWLLAALTIERVLGIYMPLKWRIYSTTQNARIGIIAIYISLAGINMHYFWSYGPVYIIDEKNVTTKATGCSISTDDPNLEHFMLNYRPTMDLITRTFLPFAVIVIGIVMIISKLKKQLKSRDHLTQSKNEFRKIDKYGAENVCVEIIGYRQTLCDYSNISNTEINMISKKAMNKTNTTSSIVSLTSNMRTPKKQGDSMDKMTLMLISASINYIVLVAPMAIMYLIEPYNPGDTTICPDANAQHALIWSCLLFVFYTNFCANFFMYCASGKQFRDEIMNILYVSPS